MKLSVVVCTWNRCGLLKRALDTLRQAAVPEDLRWEVILVDNNSDDGTKLICEEAAGGNAPEVRYVFEESRGISHARNRGVREARGEIIAFTDDDVMIDPGWVQGIRQAFDEHGRAACVGGKILPRWEGSRPAWLGPNLYHCLALLDHGDSAAYLDSPQIWGANFAVRAEMFGKYGLFDSRLGRIPDKLYGYEETDFLLRLQGAGEKVLYDPRPVVYHCVPAEKMSKRYFRKWNFDAGELNGIVRNLKYLHLANLESLTAGRMARDIAAGLLNLACFSRDRFSHELRLRLILGFLLARIRRMKMA